MEWTFKWPEVPGYGWCFGNRNREAELHLVKVRQIANGVYQRTFSLQGRRCLWNVDCGYVA